MLSGWIESKKMGSKVLVKIITVLLLVFATTGCVEKTNNVKEQALWQWDDAKRTWLYEGKPAVIRPTEDEVWATQAKAISLTITSPQALHTFDKAPRALAMKFFQLSDQTAFLQATQSKSGLLDLLKTEQIDSTNLATQRLIILPGTTQTLSFDRQEGARYVVVILGYANLKQEQIFRLIPIVPINNEVTVDKSNPFSAALDSFFKPKSNAPEPKATKDMVHPAQLKLKLSLADSSIDKLEIEVQ